MEFNGIKSTIYDEVEKEKEKEDGPQNKKTKKVKGFKTFHLAKEIYQRTKNIGYKNKTPILKK